jgi:hypothetical protein
MTKTTEVYVGIDPGWKNLGFALAVKNEETGKISKHLTAVHNPSSFKNINAYIKYLDTLLKTLTVSPISVTMERYVAYQGVFSSESENINLLIGALIHYFGSSDIWNVEPNLVRAIDWKIPLVKSLVRKKGFDNPSSNLDKKFSFAAAAAVMDEKIEKLDTDHEADALCLSVLPLYIKLDK